MKRTFALMALLALFGLQHTVSAAIIKKVAPTFWWADMKNVFRRDAYITGGSMATIFPPVM